MLHHVTVEVLRDNFYELSRAAAPGVDETKWHDYEVDLEEMLIDLHGRIHSWVFLGAYRALPSKRTWIPKTDGKLRPIGIAAIEDKIVQAAVRCVLQEVLRRHPQIERIKILMAMITNDRMKLNSIRSRLSDVSWWMRFLSQKIAQRANREDSENGKFWQARYRAVRLLDETAILACAAYVDLNPIRAAMAATIETSDYTSGQQRAIALQAEVNEQSTLKHDAGKISKPIAHSLCPLTIDELKDAIGACCHTAGCRASDKGFLPMSVASYLELLDWTARELRSDKRSATPANAAPIFERLGIDANTWCELTRDFGKLFSTVAGKPKVIEMTRSRQRHHRYKIRNRAKELLATQ